MKLINVSNHSSKNWTKKQIEKWENVEDISFPNVPANATTEEILSSIMPDVVGKIGSYEYDGYTHIMLQGEFTLCYMIKDFLRKEGSKLIFVVPASERNVIEKDGIKTSRFEFFQWRVLN